MPVSRGRCTENAPQSVYGWFLGHRAIPNDVSPRKSIHSLSGVDPIAHAALGYLARRARTVAQMTAYLGRLGASATNIRSLIKISEVGLSERSPVCATMGTRPNRQEADGL